MSNLTHWFNIQGCLEKYRDISSTEAWLFRASRDLDLEKFGELVDSIDLWLLKNASYDDLAEKVLNLLSDFDPRGDHARRAQYEYAKKNAMHAQLAREEFERITALRIEAENQERLRLEQLRKQVEAQRNELLHKLRNSLQLDFLGADIFFQTSCTEFITEQEFEAEKRSFVREWLAANTSNNQLPDDEQVAAIAALHGHIQVVARAGSGKTTTLVSRALFLLKHCHVAPHDVMILAFNRKAALEIRRRLLGLIENGADEAINAEVDRRIRDARDSKKIDRGEIEANAVDAVALRANITLPHVMTFHALGYAIVHPTESILHNGADGESQGLSRVLQQVIDDKLQNGVFRAKIRELMLAHFRDDWDRIIEGRYDQSKEELLRFRRSLPRESMGGEYVKSFGEKVIADFLFEHDIAYKYERNHWWSGINYRPDFTIFKTPKCGVIIEYFGLQGESDYDEMSQKKRAYWSAKPDWILLEFLAVDIARDGAESFRDRLKERLEDEKITCVRLSEEEIWHRVRDRAIDRFTGVAGGFIGRCRKLSLSPASLKELIDSYSPLSPVEGMFLDIAYRLYLDYLERLTATKEDDFDGLMQRAEEAVNSGHTRFKRKSGSGDLASLR